MGKISKLRLPAEPDKRPADEGVNAAELAVLTGERHAATDDPCEPKKINADFFVEE